jgi:hypothetical protein
LIIVYTHVSSFELTVNIRANPKEESASY